MQSLSQRERQAKVGAIEDILSCLNDSPFRIDGAFFSRREMAERILREVEQVEGDFENKWYESHVASGENYPRIPF